MAGFWQFEVFQPGQNFISLCQKVQIIINYTNRNNHILISRGNTVQYGTKIHKTEMLTAKEDKCSQK